MDIVIGGISAALFVSLVVQGFKAIGLPDRFAPHAALGLSLLIAIAYQLAAQYPGMMPWLEAIGGGIVMWLTATGIYHSGQNIAQGMGLVKPKE